MDIARSICLLEESENEDIYRQYFSAYLSAEEDGDIELGELYHQQLRDLVKLQDLSICDVISLETEVINAMAQRKEILLKLNEDDIDEGLEELQSTGSSKLLN